MEYYWGDKVICISNIIDKRWEYRVIDSLIVGETYTVIARDTRSLGVYYKLDSVDSLYYRGELFMGIQEYRDKVINEILD